MASVVMDLKPNHDLLDPNFDGYKLSLDPLPLYSVGLEAELDTVSLRDDQYTLQHAKAFGLHNHLCYDQWNNNILFYVDVRWKVMKYISGQSLSMQAPDSVFQIPEATESRTKKDRLNVTLHCSAKDWVVIGDGVGQLYVIYTGDRTQDNNWKICYKDTPVLFEEGEESSPVPFTVIHSVLHSDTDGLHIDVLLLHVDKNPLADNENHAPQFLTKLTWVTLFTGDNEKFEVERTRTLSSPSSPDYTALDPAGKVVYVASPKPFQFVQDSLIPIEHKEETNGETEDTESPVYIWTQTADDVTLFFGLPEGIQKTDLGYTLSCDAILQLEIKNTNVLLQGELFGKVDVDASTWTLDPEQRKLEIHLKKCEPSTWSEVIIGDKRGRLVADFEQVEEIHERLAHLTSDRLNPEPDSEQKPYNVQQLEECDELPDDTSSLVCIHGDSHQITHQASLGSHQWLFNVQSDAAKPPCICVRHDVDGVIWQPITDEESSPWKHVATFNAFGYVQASKQQRKFCNCSPNFKYVVICDCVRHIYIYRQPSAIASPLRNRITHRTVTALAKQQLVSIDSVETISGLHVGNDKLFLIAGKTLFMVRVNEDNL